jgi:hypothetical protein
MEMESMEQVLTEATIENLEDLWSERRGALSADSRHTAERNPGGRVGVVGSTPAGSHFAARCSLRHLEGQDGVVTQRDQAM